MMDALEGLKNAFLQEKKQEDRFQKEKSLMNDVVKYTSSLKGTTPVKGYDSEEVLEFLKKPIPEIKKCLGYEMADDELRTLVYSLSPKVKKFGNFMT